MIHFQIFGDNHGQLDTYVELALKSFCSFQVGDMGFNYKPLSRLDPDKHVFIGGNHDNYDLELIKKITEPCAIDFNQTILGQGRHNFAEQNLGYRIHDYFDHDYNSEELLLCKYTNMPKHYLGNFGTWQIPETDSEIFYVRGAWSIDGKFRRAKGKDSVYHWWPREQMSEFECTQALEAYEEAKPEIVISHAAPTSVMSHLTLGFSGGEIFPTQTDRLLDEMFKVHKPKFWFFGHFHQLWSGEIEGTNFYCLNKFPDEGWILKFDKQLNLIEID